MPGAVYRAGHFLCRAVGLENSARVRECKVNSLKSVGIGRQPLVAASAIALSLSVLAGCAPKPIPAPPLPPPPAVVIQPMPTPPNGAPTGMAIPPVDAVGNRMTVNYGISTPQAVWNLRSAYNVAALNCLEAQYVPVLDGYKRFLKVYAKQLDAANKKVDAGFQALRKGRDGTVARETYQTQVYNFFSLPPVDTGLCRAAMDLSAELQTVAPTQLEAWSVGGLSRMEAPFRAFFDSYDRYRNDLAAWHARYGTSPVAAAPAVAPSVMQQGAPR